MTNTSTSAIIIDRQAFIINFLNETVWAFFPPLLEAKGHKLTCKIDKICFCLESQSHGVETGHFSLLKHSVQLWASSDPGMTEWILKRGPESSGGLSITPSRLWAQRRFNCETGSFSVIIACWCHDGERKTPEMRQWVPLLLSLRITKLILKH